MVGAALRKAAGGAAAAAALKRLGDPAGSRAPQRLTGSTDGHSAASSHGLGLLWEGAGLWGFARGARSGCTLATANALEILA